MLLFANLDSALPQLPGKQHDDRRRVLAPAPGTYSHAAFAGWCHLYGEMER